MKAITQNRQFLESQYHRQQQLIHDRIRDFLHHPLAICFILRLPCRTQVRQGLQRLLFYPPFHPKLLGVPSLIASTAHISGVSRRIALLTEYSPSPPSVNRLPRLGRIVGYRAPLQVADRAQRDHQQPRSISQRAAALVLVVLLYRVHCYLQ